MLESDSSNQIFAHFSFAKETDVAKNDDSGENRLICARGTAVGDRCRYKIERAVGIGQPNKVLGNVMKSLFTEPLNIFMFLELAKSYTEWGLCSVLERQSLFEVMHTKTHTHALKRIIKCVLR